VNVLASEIKLIISGGIAQKPVLLRFTERLNERGLTRDENPVTHFCAYFLPYNKEVKKIFIIHHKKSGLWLSPGGHIDKGENLMATLNREIHEELGITNKIMEPIQPFLLTITPISNEVQPCKEHLDIWYRVPMTENEMNVSPEEFYESRWVALSEARKLITDPATIEALERMEEVLFPAS